jgi:endoglucanase
VPGGERTRSGVIAVALLVVAIGVVGLAIVAMGQVGGPAAGPTAAPSAAPATSSSAPSTAAATVAATTPVASPSVSPSPRLFVPDPNPGAIAQLEALRRAGKTADAGLLQAMLDTPSSVWFEGGSPSDVEREVRALLARTAETIPVLVAYNLPGRDCAQYSAGGAQTGDAYRAWIRGFANGIGDHRAVAIIEPDGLALQPVDCGQPDTFDREALFGAAVDTLRAENANAAVYLDAGHSAWHPAPEMAGRLVRAGVRRATGFFLNASNYRTTADLVAYGTAISACIGLAGTAGDCSGAVAGSEAPGDTAGGGLGAIPFVIDTSRNGQGPWTPTVNYAAAQDWCNPPGRGLGLRPTLDTGVPLVDGYLWIKIPGESDGTCTRGAPRGSPDPEWHRVDPAAGQWFPEQALQLARLASPPLVP